MIHTPNWKKVKQIFSEAIELEGEERAKFIRNACKGDEAILREIESLIRSYYSPGPLDQPVHKITSSILSELDLSDKTGQMIGPYKITTELGKGGMGTVFLAERDDDQFSQQVALKLLHTGFISDHQTRRFLTERQILASLNHPNIAGLLDGGITLQGIPWFAMEHVEGRPIDQYCNENQLTINERLNLFLDICKAVQFAHSKLIIHRDIKPSNILVTSAGDVKLLDFGIAKVMNDGTEQQPDKAPVTKTGLLPLTPAYASPEQVRGEPVTVASDIYQLGMVLYELLTGSRPYDVAGRTPSEIEQIICEENPTRPSTAITKIPTKKTMGRIADPALLRKKLKGDLDTIILKALRKEPGRRYESAEQFSADIEHFLSGRPVAAHPDSRLYRTKKFVNRHKPGVSSAAAILLLLIGYAITITWHSQQTSRALIQAQLEAEKSEQVIGFLMGMFEASDPAEALGDTVTARVLLERGIEEAEKLADQPEVQAQMYSVVGRVFYELGEYGRAHPLLEKALDLQEKGDWGSDIERANKYYQMGGALHHQGRYRESDTYFVQALEIYEQHPGYESEEYAGSLYRMGDIRKVRNDPETALSMHQEALSMRLNLLGDQHLDVGVSYYGLGNTMFILNDFKQALTYFEKASDIYKNTYKENHPRMAGLKVAKARTLRAMGQTGPAKEHLLSALEDQTEIFGRNHTTTGLTMLELANFYRAIGEFDNAERTSLDLISIIDEELGDSHPLRRPAVQTLGRIYMQSGSPALAEPWLTETLALLKATLQPHSQTVLTASRELSICLIELEQYQQAEELLLENLDLLSRFEEEPYLARKEEFLEITVRLYEKWGDEEKMSYFKNLPE